jgi:hypothetical protein
LYTQANGVWWYYCICCTNNANAGYCNAPSSVNLGANPQIPCPDGRCIGSCSGKPSDLQRIYHWDSPHTECRFHLDPTAKPNPTARLYADAYINGILRQTSADLDSQISHGGPSMTVTKAGYVSYNDGSRTRTIGLYDVVYSGGKCDLHVGMEVTDNPAGATAPDEWGLPFAMVFKHYHHVYKYNHKYHVATTM